MFHNLFNYIPKVLHNFFSDKRFSEILIGSVWSLGARAIATVISMLTTIIIVRFYGAEVMGILVILSSFLMFTTIFTTLGTSTAILRLIPEHISKYSPTSAYKVYRKTLYFVAVVSIIIGSSIFFTSDFVANTIFSKPHMQFYFSLGACFIIFNSLKNLNTQAVRGVRLIRLFALMQLLPTLSKFIILMPITIWFYHLDNPIYAMFASIAITALTGLWIMSREFKKKKKSEDIQLPIPLNYILKMSTPMLMTATITFVIGQTGVVMLGIFRTDAEVGYYAIAVKMATLSSAILSAVNSMAAPKFSELYHLNKFDELFYIAKKSAKLIFWSTIPILLIIIFFGKPIISIFYGKEFVVAYWPMIILIVGELVNSCAGSTAFFMNMTGHQNIIRNFVFIAALINVSVNVMLTPVYGLYGASIAATLTIMLWNISTLCYIKRKFGMTIGYLPLLS
jgi:O-antigen/teichoic acid export membrane protein